jgi:hypothetical protein
MIEELRREIERLPADQQALVARAVASVPDGRRDEYERAVAHFLRARMQVSDALQAATVSVPGLLPPGMTI